MWYECRVELPASVTTIVRGTTTFHIVGTAHVSQRSVDDVRAVIAAVKPDVVCVELDKARLDALTQHGAFRNLDIFKVVREGKTLYLLAHLALASYQRRIGRALGVKPGAELLAAVEAAQERVLPIELVDRDINVTLRRAWRNLGLWKRAMLLSSLMFGWGDGKGEPVTESTVEDLKEPRALSEMLTELGRAVPEVKGPLIDERDRYMASKLDDIAAGGRTTIVAVVGAAHVPGITAALGTPIDRAKLETIPPPSLVWRVLKWAVPLAFVAILVLLWRRTDASGFAATMLGWIIPTAVGGGLCTLVAGGSLVSTGAAIVASPVGRVYPLVRTSIVVGIVEAWWRKPSVADCERLADDTQSVRGFFRNPVTRILIIAIASGIGSAIGFWVGVGYLASAL